MTFNIYEISFEAFRTQFSVTVGHPAIKQRSIQIVAKLCYLIVGLAVPENYYRGFTGDSFCSSRTLSWVNTVCST